MESLKSYGITGQAAVETQMELCLEELKIKGFTVVPDVLSSDELVDIRKRIDSVYSAQEKESGFDLAEINEKYVARMLFAYDDYFFSLLNHSKIIPFVKSVLGEYFNLQLQNAIINMPEEEHHQSSWHRDLPYQNYTSSKPLALNAIYCIDNFTKEMGATMALPFSHRVDAAPSATYFTNHGITMEAPAGAVVLMDSMVFHRAGRNSSDKIRRAINQVYISGMIKPQMNIPALMKGREINDSMLRMLFGLDVQLADSVKQFREQRRSRSKK
jgi:ectoine hydroxylase-related dioxygenase (phytanoyl-CoA dioxygenase family)